MNEPTYYKAVRPDGTDFHSGRIDYAAALASGDTITHPVGNINSHTAADYLTVSVSPTDCTGAQWPCRLFRVEPIGPVGVPGVYPSKRPVAALRVVEELPAVEALGPQGQAIVALIERARALTLQEVSDLAAAREAVWDAAGAAAWDAAGAAAWDAAGDAAWDAARDAARAAAWEAVWDAAWAAAWAAAWDAVWDAVWDAAGAAARDAVWDAAWAAAWDAAGDAAWAAVVRDLIGTTFTQEQYDLLTGPWRKVVGPVHPDDADIR